MSVVTRFIVSIALVLVVSAGGARAEQIVGAAAECTHCDCADSEKKCATIVGNTGQGWFNGQLCGPCAGDVQVEKTVEATARDSIPSRCLPMVQILIAPVTLFNLVFAWRIVRAAPLASAAIWLFSGLVNVLLFICRSN